MVIFKTFQFHFYAVVFVESESGDSEDDESGSGDFEDEDNEMDHLFDKVSKIGTWRIVRCYTILERIRCKLGLFQVIHRM